jgi:hypothetical protein
LYKNNNPLRLQCFASAIIDWAKAQYITHFNEWAKAHSYSIITKKKIEYGDKRMG